MSGEDVTRLLKLGVTQGDDFLYRAYFVAPSKVSVGQNPRATIHLQHDEVPDHFELFSIQDESCMLQFDRQMDLAFLYDGLFRRPNFLIDEGLAFRHGRKYFLNLESRARGTLNLGPFRLLFKLEVVERPNVRRIQMPETPNAPVKCAACGQSMQAVLTRPGVVSRCGYCKALNRFEGITGGEMRTVERPALLSDPEIPTTSPPVHETKETKAPITLNQPASPPSPPGSPMTEANTVLDAGVLQDTEGSAPQASSQAPNISLPETPSQGESMEERDTLNASNNMLRSPSHRKKVRKAVSGDRHGVVDDDADNTATSAWSPQSEQGGSWSAPEIQTGPPPPSAPASRESGGNVVPLPVSNPRIGTAGITSAPHPAVPETSKQEQAQQPGYTTDSYASARLADRLTMLIFTLVMIAVLLAAILGVLLMQGAMGGRDDAPPAPSDETGALELPADEHEIS